MFEFTCILAYCIAPRTKQSLEWEYNRRSLHVHPAKRATQGMWKWQGARGR